MANANPPGVMIYQDLRPAIAYLSDADKGRLLDAILCYAANGQPLADADGALAAIWALLQPRIDRDAVAYRVKCRKAAYAAYVRSCKHIGRAPEPYSIWDRRTSDAIVSNPTTYPDADTGIDISAPTYTRDEYDRIRHSGDMSN